MANRMQWDLGGDIQIRAGLCCPGISVDHIPEATDILGAELPLLNQIRTDIAGKE